MNAAIGMGRIARIWMLALALGTVLGSATGATPGEPVAPRIEALRAELPGGLEAADAESIGAMLDQAEADDAAAGESVEQASALRADAEAASTQIAALEGRRARDHRRELDEWRALLPEEEPVDSAESRLQVARGDLEASRRALSRLQSELADLLGQPRTLVDELSEARGALEDRRDRRDAAAASADTEATLLQRARLAAADAALRRAEARVGLLEARQQTLPSRQRLLEARRRQLEREVSLGQQRLDVLQARVERFRDAAASERQRNLLETQEGIAGDWPQLAQEVDANLELIDRLQALEASLTTRRQDAEASARQMQATEDVLRSTRSRLALEGTDEALGLVLLAERRRLPDVRRLQRELDEVRRQLANARLSALDLNDRLIGLDDVESAIARASESTGDEDSTLAERDPEMLAALEQLLETRAQLLPALLETTQQLVTSLSGHETSLQEQIAVTSELEALLDRRLLWIPSHATVDMAWLARHPAGWYDLYKPSRFPTTARLLRRAMGEHWDVVLAALLLLGAIPLLHRRVPGQLEEWAGRLRHVNDDRFRYTAGALGLTLLAALPAAMAVFALAWLLQNVGEAGRYSDSLGRALAGVAPTLYVASLVYWLSRPMGLAAAHFRWTDARLRALMMARRWLLWAVVPLQFTLSLAFIRNLDPALDTAGRDALLALCVVFAWLSWRMLAPDGLWVTSEGGSHHRLRRFARVLVPSALAAMAMLVLAGFMLSAAMLVFNLAQTALLLLALGALHALAARWLLLGERRLAMRRYLERKAAEAEAEAQVEVTTEAGEVIPDIEPDEVTLQSVNAQTRRLLRALVITLLGIGLLWVWAGLLPALGRLDEIVLWEVSAVDASGVGFLEAISLKAVLFGLFALALTFIAARNLPGLVEIGLLSSEAVDAPTRYAITSISRYLIVIVGMMIGVGLLGVRWSQLQWMAAALTVGLGFGLQEIFANFISGIILLFERPFRVGDVITVGNEQLTGTVTKIRTRATTLRDFENKEIVVPNKTFITGQLINWTLTDTRTRITVKVGVAYGTPPEKVHALLRQAAEEHPLVMKDPGPASWFMAFGASSLDFELRVFVSSFSDRLVTLNELNMRIAELFAEHGIEIAFPQMDLHVRDLPPRRSPPPRQRDDDPGEPAPAT